MALGIIFIDHTLFEGSKLNFLKLKYNAMKDECKSYIIIDWQN